jgi:hypothetical protein
MQTAHTLLARNGVAHRWIDTDTDPLGGLLVEYCGLGLERPVAVFADGSQLPAPVDLWSLIRSAMTKSLSRLTPPKGGASG